MDANLVYYLICSIKFNFGLRLFIILVYSLCCSRKSVALHTKSNTGCLY